MRISKANQRPSVLRICSMMWMPPAIFAHPLIQLAMHRQGIHLCPRNQHLSVNHHLSGNHLDSQQIRRRKMRPSECKKWSRMRKLGV